jgi:Na+/melibiose symporter-like transporter
MSVVPAAFAFGMAAILAWGYPLDRAALARLREQLTAARAQPAA